MKRILFVLVFIGVFFFNTGIVLAANQTLYPAKDANIYSSPVNNNYGASATAVIRGSGPAGKILAEFNLSGMPSNSIINSAHLSLYAAAGSSRTIAAYRLTRAWVEGDGEGSVTGNGATWENATGSLAWTTAGGDYDSLIWASAVTNNANLWSSWNITNLVQNWVNGTSPNYGLILVQTSGTNSQTFATKENSNSSLRPILTINYTSNNPPSLDSISIFSDIIKGGDILTIYANTSSNSVNDTEADTLHLYCDNSTTPNATNTDCSGGTTSSGYPYILSCTYAVPQTNANYIEFCRVYDETDYSSAVSTNYASDSNSPATSIISIAGDTAANYFDAANDGRTDIVVSGETGMLCKWSASDAAYSLMSNECAMSETQANCSINDVSSQGLATRYISCKDSLDNEQNSSNNLNAQFYLDYTAPTTTEDSSSVIQTPSRNVAINESDNAASDPITYYCTSPIPGCNPITPIDNGEIISYTDSDRGANYLRYYSLDDAGNSQVIVNKTININQLPIFSSAFDDAATIKGGSIVNVSTNSYDLDSGQESRLYICSSLGANSSGCTGTQYCNAIGNTNLSCAFTSESDSAIHNWYAYFYDELEETASANPLIGSYTTDSQAPTIILANPLDNSNITQSSVTFTIVVNEALTNAWYSIDSGTNVSMNNISPYLYTNSNTLLSNGCYNLSIWANDSYGNIGFLSGSSFTIDTSVNDAPPIITIISPINQIYSTNLILLSILLNKNATSVNYSLDGAANVSLAGSGNSWNTTINSSYGGHNILFYAIDSAGNFETSTLVYFSIADTAPQTIIQTQTIYGGGGGGVTAAKESSESIIYDGEIELLSGEEGEFTLDVYNNYTNAILENLTLILIGISGENISITPDKISRITSGEIKQFSVKFRSFNYSDYAEYNLNAVIKGRITKGGITKNYTESKLIKIIIQSISKKDAEKRLSEAEKAIFEMRESNLSTLTLEYALNQSKFWLNEKRVYKKSWELSDQIVKTKDVASEADDLLRNLILSMESPQNNNLIGSNAVKNFGSFQNEKPLRDLLTGKAVLASNSIGNLIGQAIAAFEKGEYYTALAIAKEARDSLLLERSANPLLLVYAYWPFILLALLAILMIGIFSFRMHQKSYLAKQEKSIANKLKNLFKSFKHKIGGLFQNLALKGKKDVMIVDHRIVDFLKSISKGKDLKGKIIKINLN